MQRLVKNNATITAADWSTASVDELPDSCFAYISPGGSKDSSGKTTPRSLRHLPYKGADGKPDLPHVRNALARLDATQIPDSVKAGIKSKLESMLNTTKAAEFATATEIMAADDAGVPTEIEILRPGDWSDTPGHPSFTVSADDLDDYASNFKAGVRKAVPIDIEHREDKKYGGEAAGWLTDTYTTVQDGVKKLMGKVDWNPVGRDVLTNKKYKFVSAEFVPKGYKDPEGKLPTLNNVLKAVTLTNFPLMKGLQPVVASEGQEDGRSYRLMDKIIINEEDNALNLDDIRTKDAAALSDEEKSFVKEQKDSLSDAEKTKFGLAEAQAQADKADDKDKVETPAAKVEETVAANDSPTVTITASEKEELVKAAEMGRKAFIENETRKASDFAEELIKKGQIKSQQKDQVVQTILATDSDKVDDFKKFLNGLPENKLITAGEIGKSESGDIGQAISAFESKISEYIVAHEKDNNGKGVTYDEAFLAITTSEPDLSKAARAEIEGGN